MSPDIEWHIGEDEERETIRAASPRRSRRSWIAILIVVVLGVGLGAMYRSIPEPAPRPTPHPAPTYPALPAKLYATIDREAQALADGDFNTYLAVHTPFAPEEAQRQRLSFTDWGRPGAGQPLYQLIDLALPADDRAWADIRQFRDDRFFRETRFYSREGDRWLRASSPDTSLWSGHEGSLQTPHFVVTYAIEDQDLISPTLRQIETDYQALCRSLNCTSAGHELTFTLNLNAAGLSYASPARTGVSEIWLRSPRVTGFFESGRAYTWKNNAVHSALGRAIVEETYGRPSRDRLGGGILWAATLWALNRLDPLPSDFRPLLEDLKQKSALSVNTLWSLSAGTRPGPVMAQLYQFIRFVEQEYGSAAIAQLLGAIGADEAPAAAIEKRLGVPFDRFDLKWQTWIRVNLAQPQSSGTISPSQDSIERKRD